MKCYSMISKKPGGLLKIANGYIPPKSNYTRVLKSLSPRYLAWILIFNKQWFMTCDNLSMVLHTDHLIGSSLPFPKCMLCREVTYLGKVCNSKVSPHGSLFFSMITMGDHAKQRTISLVLKKYFTKAPLMAKKKK